MEASRGVKHSAHPNRLKPDHLPGLPQDSVGAETDMDSNPLLLRLLDFEAGSWQLMPIFEGDHMNLGHAQADRSPGHIEGRMQDLPIPHRILGPFPHRLARAGDEGAQLLRGEASEVGLGELGPERGARRIDRHVPASYDDHLVAQVDAVALIHIEKEVDRFEHPVQVRALDGKVATLAQARPEEHGVKLAPEIRQAHLFSNGRVQAELNAKFKDGPNLPIEELPGEPVEGNALAEHASRFRRGFEHGYRMTQQSQVVGRRQTGRSCPDDGDTTEAPAGLGGEPL
jgi:hypothetical protein